MTPKLQTVIKKYTWEYYINEQSEANRKIKQVNQKMCKLNKDPGEGGS
jgi:hypothetical protein